MRTKQIFWLIPVFTLLVIFGFREYQTRQTFQLQGQINSCRYSDATRFCSLFTTSDGKNFLLAEGSILKLKQISPDISKIYKKPIKISAHILGQKIGVEGKGKINRIEVIQFEI